MTDFLQQIAADLQEAAERRVTRRRRTMLIRVALAACVVAAVVVVSALLAGSSLTGDDRQAAGERESAPPVPATEPASCEIGAKPDYFVPSDGPSALLGCARLGVSGQRVEFSGNLARIDGAEHLCINPAYSSGAFIPALCKLEPPVSEFGVRDAMQPRQSAKGYAYVIWGTAGSAQSVVASFDGGATDAARLAVPAEVASEYGESPFALFVVELPLSAACGPVTIEADGTTARIEPKPRECRHP